MSENRPTVPLGDAVRKLSLPGWLRTILNFLKGTRIQAGPVDILLDKEHGAMPPRTGLDQPGTFNPPRIGGPRR